MNTTKYAGPVLRYSLAIVFLYFSISQFMMPDDWTGFLPAFILNMPNPVMFIYANATFELIFSILLITGLFTRTVSFLLALHLVGITATLGLNPIGVRDFGLTFACLAITLLGPDEWCLDSKIAKKFNSGFWSKLFN